MPRPLEIEITRRLVGQITNYFRNRKFNVEAEILDKGKIETQEGIDAVVIVGDKVWGFQTKRIYGKSYNLEKGQHSKVHNKSWVYYAFAEDVPRKEFGNILHRTIFSKGNFNFKEKLKEKDIPDKNQWGVIAKGIEECPIGLKINDKASKKSFGSELKEIANEYLSLFIINEQKQELKVKVGSIELIDGRYFKFLDKDKKRFLELKRTSKTLKGKCPRCGWPE